MILNIVSFIFIFACDLIRRTPWRKAGKNRTGEVVDVEK
jgi:hypothetical protein